MSNKDYGQIMCEAVDTIIAKRLNGISYDQTVLCTIVDNTNKAQGKYIVQKDNVKFEVYSTNTEYNKNDNVYVQIPEGDQNQDKFIIGKKINSSNQESYVYNKPFNSLVDITGNIATNSISGNSTGLIANGELNYIDLWSYSGEALTEYTRLGIQASFQSWLNPFTDTNGETRRVTKGEYGLELTIEVEERDTQSKNSLLSNTYILYLNTNDMNGNPYEFDTYFQQEKVFDISQFKNITEMSLRFYQKKGSFKDSEEILLPVYTADSDITKPQSTSNLFVNDIYIYVGYDIDDFTDEKVQIYSLNSSTYTEEAKDSKKLQLRWIHKQEDGSFKSITADDELDFEVRWYRYKLGSPSADSYSGVYWKYLSTQNNTEYLIQDEDWIKYNENNEEDINPTFFTSYLFPNYDKAQEQVKVILLYNGQVLRSNILTFTNEKEVVNDATLDAINSVNALQIHCSDGTFGNYRIYGDNNYLVNSGDANGDKDGNPRKFVAYFSEDPEATPAILTEAEEITWIIPAKNTMIKIADNITASEDGNYYITPGQDENGQIINEQSYYINKYYSPSLVNNTIQCEIIKNGRTYKTSKELSFGVMGTTGTTCTLVLDFEHPGQNGIQINNNAQVDQIKNYTIVANLYDADNKNITSEALDETKIWSWGWYEGSTGNITIGSNDKNKCVLEKNITSISGNEWNILQCTLKGWGDFDLIAYLPIPLKWEIVGTCVPQYLEGTDIIVYNTEGLADYYKGSYKLIDVDNTSQNNFTWSINESNDPFGPQLTKNNAIQASNVYIEDSTKGFVVNCKYDETIVWSQPLLIIQNRYPNSTINQWDGNFKVNENDNELLAARIAAGIKDSNNTFTGVAIGDWDFASDVISPGKHTGVYGFNQGAMSYAFKDDGTAFIGKDGSGRIIFKGDSGEIYSGTWKTNELGMYLGIDNGIIKLQAQNKITNGSGKEYITLSADESTYPLSIGNNITTSARNFRVDWDGKLYATNGYFSGEINATSGNFTGSISSSKITGTALYGNTIYADDGVIGYNSLEYDKDTGAVTGATGGWKITSDTLTGRDNNNKSTIVLTASTGKISGAQIEASTISSNDGTVKLNGYLSIQILDIYGDNTLGNNKLGFVQAKTNNSSLNEASQGIGLKYTGNLQYDSTSFTKTSELKLTDISAGLIYGGKKGFSIAETKYIDDSGNTIYNPQVYINNDSGMIYLEAKGNDSNSKKGEIYLYGQSKIYLGRSPIETGLYPDYIYIGYQQGTLGTNIIFKGTQIKFKDDSSTTDVVTVDFTGATVKGLPESGSSSTPVYAILA